jgi:hypothetical protein
LQRQNVFHEEILLQQENNFKSFIQMTMESTNKRLDDQTEDVQDITTSLLIIQKDVDVLKTTQDALPRNGSSMWNEFTTVKEDLQHMSGKAE